MRRDKFGIIDTSQAVEDKMFELLRQKSPRESLAMVFSRIEFARSVRKRTEHLRKPDANADR